MGALVGTGDMSGVAVGKAVLMGAVVGLALGVAVGGAVTGDDVVGATEASGSTILAAMVGLYISIVACMRAICKVVNSSMHESTV